MNETALHNAIEYFEAIGAWTMAEQLRNILRGES